MRAITTLTVASLLLIGCSGTPAPTETVTATVEAIVTATPEPAALEYGERDGVSVAPIVKDVAELHKITSDAGLACGPEFDGYNESDMAIQCGGDGLVVLTAAEDSEDGRAFIRSGIGLAVLAFAKENRADVAVLAGPNWFVRLTLDDAYQLQEKIGGSVIAIR